jgi:virulence factor Mce-like protein
MSSVLLRRVVGTLAAVLLIGGGKLLIDVVAAPPAGSYEVTAHLGAAGKGLQPGSDVKVRGVLTGKVRSIVLDDRANAVATLTIWPTHPLPRDLDVAVTSKTFLGTKQIELRPPDGRLDAPRQLGDGDVLRVDEGGEPVEPQEFLAAIEPFLDAIDPVEIGQVVDTFGSFDREDAETAGRNIDLGSELAEFGARTADDQIDRVSSLATLTGELATTAADFNRLNRSLPRWVSLLPDRQPAIRTNLEALSAFSLTFAEFLGVEEDAIGDVLEVSTVVNGVLAGQAEDLSDMIFGIYRYSLKLGQHGGALEDGSEHGWFTVFLGDEEQLDRLCRQLPPEFQEIAPGCVAEDGGRSRR